MTRFWFRRNHQAETTARVAEASRAVSRQESYNRAKDATLHLMTALKQWPGFDSTGSIIGVIDHTQVNIDRLDDALDDLRDQIDAFRREILLAKFQPADLSARGAVRPDVDVSVEEIDVKAITKAMATAVQVVPTPVTAAFARRKPVDGASK